MGRKEEREFLKRVRRMLGLTTGELATKLIVSLNTVEAIEKGNRSLAAGPIDMLVELVKEKGLLHTDPELIAFRDHLRQKRFDKAIDQLLGPRHQIPSFREGFVGRDNEIDELIAALRATKGVGGAVAILSGLAGVGKTELAFVVAHHLHQYFPDAQIFLEIGGSGRAPLTQEEVMRHVVRSLNRTADDPRDTKEQLRAKLYSLLNKERVLILADDVASIEQIEPLLRIPAGCALLITTHDRSIAADGALSIHFETLPESETLVRNLCGRADRHTAHIAALCSYLPLAIHICVAVLNSSTRNIDSLLDEFAENNRKILMSMDRGSPRGSINAALTQSYNLLSAKAKDALCRLSVFPTSFDRTAAKAVIACDGAEDLLDELYRLSLLEWYQSLDRYTLQELVRDFAAAQLKDVHPVYRRYADYYAKVAAHADWLYQTGGESARRGLAIFDQERVHIDAGWDWAEEQGSSTNDIVLAYAEGTINIGDIRYPPLLRRRRLEEAVHHAARNRDLALECRLLLALGNTLLMLDDPSSAIETYERGRAIADRTGDWSDPQDAILLLSGALLSLGTAHIARYKQHKESQDLDLAFQYFVQFSDLPCERHSPGDHCRLLNGLGYIYFVRNSVSQSLQYFEEALKLAREVGDPILEFDLLLNMGIAHATMGNPQQAENYYGQSIHLAADLGDRRDVLIACWNLGILLTQEGHLKEAEKLLSLWVEFARSNDLPSWKEDGSFLEEVRKHLLENT